MKFFTSVFIAVLVFAVPAAPIPGETVISDPVIPDGEKAVYSVREGDERYTFVEEVSVLHEQGRSVYRFTYRSGNETVEVWVERPAMLPFTVHTVSGGKGISIDSSTRLSYDRNFRTNGIAVLSFADLKYVLRGYPFDTNNNDIDVVFMSAGNEDEETTSEFAVSVRYTGIEELAISGRTIQCHKLELRMSGSGIMRVLKPFIPKTYFWYSVRPPHYLVAYEGSSSFPGSPKRYVEITDYSGWD